MPAELEVDCGTAPFLVVAAEVVAEVGLEAVDERLEQLDVPGRDVPAEGADVDSLAPRAPLLDEAGHRVPVHLLAQLSEHAADHGLRLPLEEHPVDERLEEVRTARQRADGVGDPLLGDVVPPGDRGEA